MLRSIARGRKQVQDILAQAGRGRKQVQEIIAQADAFPKVEESYVSTSPVGGVVTLLCWIGVLALLYSEINYYYNPVLTYKYTVDKDASQKLHINIDMTVAMACHHIGADVLDIWGQSFGDTKLLTEEAVPFELAQNQKMFLKMQSAGGEDKAHMSLGDMIGDTTRKLVPRDDQGREVEKDGCRLSGSIPVDKVQGNFHILPGRSVNIAGMGHVHLQMGEIQNKNFSHRIDGLTFGPRVQGMMYALDGEMKIAPTRDYLYQYYIQIVPTQYSTDEAEVLTYQYTVQERMRAIDPTSGSHGNSGIVIKYNFSPISAIVEQKVKAMGPFLTRLGGIVGGIFSTSGLLNLVITESIEWIRCRRGS